MVEEDPIAVFLTWTTYGTWLPGDRRGYVSNTLKPGAGFERRQNQFGTEYRRDDLYTRIRAQEAQKFPTVRLEQLEAIAAAEGLIKACSDRGWRILRAAVMTSHVHVAVINFNVAGHAVRGVLKGCSQAHMNDALGKNLRWWTAGGSNRVVSGDKAIHDVIRYIENQAGKLAEIVDMQLIVPSLPPG